MKTKRNTYRTFYTLYRIINHRMCRAGDFKNREHAEYCCCIRQRIICR